MEPCVPSHPLLEPFMADACHVEFRHEVQDASRSHGWKTFFEERADFCNSINSQGIHSY